MKALNLDKKGIYEYQQNREPYLMIDHATEVIPGVSAKGFKDFKEFKDDFHNILENFTMNYKTSSESFFCIKSCFPYLVAPEKLDFMIFG